MKKKLPALLLFGLFVSAGAVAFAAATEEQAVVGPTGERVEYVVSPAGGRLAAVAPKGSRITVVVDGVAGPQFDAIIKTGFAVIDPRPYAAIDVNLRPQPGPVTFSRDGKRYAYVGRLGEEWVVMVDNKESFRFPPATSVGATGIGGMVGNELRME